MLCIGAGGLISHIAPSLVRKGVGEIIFLDDDEVEPSNLNRQRFYEKDVGANKAIVLAQNPQAECIVATSIIGYATRLQEAVERGISLGCDLAICGVDNNPTRASASRYFRNLGVPVIFTAVSTDANHGYVFVQGLDGPCFACLHPDAVTDGRYPCPGTPAIVDILQVVGALAVYAVDSCLMSRARSWNYRRLSLADGMEDSSFRMPIRDGCGFVARH